MLKYLFLLRTLPKGAAVGWFHLALCSCVGNPWTLGMFPSPTHCDSLNAVQACLYQGEGRVHRLERILACGSSHWFSLWQGKNRASGKSSFYHVSSEASLLSGDILLDLWLEGRREKCMTAFQNLRVLKKKKKKKSSWLQDLRRKKNNDCFKWKTDTGL